MAALRRTASSLFTRSAGAWQRAAGACELAEASHAQRPPLRRASSSSSSEGARAGRLNHVAIAVPDLAQAAERFKLVLGAAVSEPQALPEHGVRVVFVQLDNTKLELLEPLSASSPIAKFLEKNPVGGVHHLCLEVNDIQAAVQHVASTPARLLDPTPKIGAHGSPVVFLHPKDTSGVLIELEEVRCFSRGRAGV